MPDGSDRRQFLVQVAAAAVAVPVLGRLAHAAEPTTAPAGAWVATVKPDTLKDGGYWDQVAKDKKFVLARDGANIYALDTACPHKSCSVNVAAAGLGCKCHGSRFTITGSVAKGPARSALSRHPIRLNDQGVIEVDPTHKADAANAVLVIKDA